MEKEIVEQFLNKFVKLETRSTYLGRNSFKLYGIIEEVTETSVIIRTDRIGAILLHDIISIEERES